MTIGIAAICEKGTVVVGLSDRMITSRGIRIAELRQTKTTVIMPTIFIMTAGDTDVSSEVITELQERVQSKTEWKVVEIGKLCQSILAEIQARKATTQVLAPFGLDTNSFISRQAEMLPSFVEKLTDDINDLPLPAVELIITGIDSSGCHIFTVSDSTLACKDKNGYAVIGIGSIHAEAEILKAGWGKWVSAAAAIFICYMGKKSAEQAPSVGRNTDILFVHTDSYYLFPEHLVADLDIRYWKMKKKELKVKTTALEEWGEKVMNAQKQNEEKLTTTDNKENV